MNTLLIIIVMYMTYARAYDEPQLRVVGGNLAPRNMFPYAVSLQQISIWNKKYRHFCTGSILTEIWILTAAHCVSEKQPQYLMVTAGTSNLEDQTGVNHAVRKIYVHPWFKETIPIIKNDVGLLLLKTPITFSETAMPINLGTLDRKKGPIVALGWGRTSQDSRISNDLQYVFLSIMGYQQCHGVHEKVGNIVDRKTHICGWGDVGKTLCFGDSGGPLVDPETNRQVGVFSGLQDCSGEYPVLFVRLSAYFPWISQVTGLELRSDEIDVLLAYILSKLCSIK